MKFSKMVRVTTVITLLTATLMNAYIHYQTNESYKKLRVSINDLKARMYELRAVANSISRQTRASCECVDSCSCNTVNTSCAENRVAKYTVINKNGMLGIYNAEDQLVGKRVINSILPDSKRDALKRGIRVKGEIELDRLLEGLVCDEETATV